MTNEMKVFKGHNGWRAETSIKIGEVGEGERKLTLSTSKIRGGLSSMVTVSVHKNPEHGFAVMTTNVFGDFSKYNICPIPCSRVTQNEVIKAHKMALPELNKLISEAKAFYENPENAHLS